MEQRNQPTEFGYHLTKLMAAAGYSKVAPFARDCDIAGSTMHRLIYGGVVSPDLATLRRIAATVARRTGDAENAVYQGLLNEIGVEAGPAATVRPFDPLAREVDDLIGEGSTLDPARRDLLRTMIDRIIDPDRQQARRQAG